MCRFEFISKFSSLDSKDPFDHQKTILFSPDGNVLLTSNTLGVLTVWDWPLLKPIFPSFHPGNDISNACFDPSSRYVNNLMPLRVLICINRLDWLQDKNVLF